MLCMLKVLASFNNLPRSRSGIAETKIFLDLVVMALKIVIGAEDCVLLGDIDVLCVRYGRDMDDWLKLAN